MMENEWRCWSNIPTELLVLIMERLQFHDQLTVGRVCRNWLSVLQSEYQNQMLLFMHHTDATRSNKFEFFNPANGSVSHVVASDLDGTFCLSSKHGWLLLKSVGVHPNLFFFNPFIMARINLPSFSHDFIEPRAGAFSSPPTSPDCMVLIVMANISFFKVNIIVCHRGERVWSWNVYDWPFTPIRHAVFCDGLFYFMNSGGRVGSFNAVDSKFSIIKTMKWNLTRLSRFPSYLIESGGEIFSCFGYRYGGYDRVRVFRLVRRKSEVVWVMARKWRNRMLFLGESSSILPAAASKRFESNIYLQGFSSCSDCILYSLENRKTDVLLSTNYTWKPVWIEPNFSPLGNQEWAC